jgi:hypothetical protein
MNWKMLDLWLPRSLGTRGSVVVKTLCYKSEGHGFETWWGDWIFPIFLILLAALGPGVHSAYNRTEYQKQKNNVSACVCLRGQCIRLTTLLPSVSQLSRQYEILNISQHYRPPRPVTEIALLSKSTINWNMAPYSPLEADHCFGGRCCLHFEAQGRVTQAMSDTACCCFFLV